MRCGFCNLFTRANAPGRAGDRLSGPAAAAGRAGGRTRSVTGAGFARAAFGGGTPTYLSADELAELFAIVTGTMGVALPGCRCRWRPRRPPPPRTGSRCWPRTARTRVSIGVQSFLDSRGARGRPAAAPHRGGARRSAAIRDAAGAGAQHRPDLRHRRADARDLGAEPGRRARAGARGAVPLPAVRAAADRARPPRAHPRRLGRPAARRCTGRRSRRCRAAGYRQESMRQFRRADVPAPDGPDYCCQDDGMVGLGCGARSYTTGSALLVRLRGQRAAGARGASTTTCPGPARTSATPSSASRLDGAEQRRRWLLKSLLRAEGVDAAAYRGPLRHRAAARTSRSWPCWPTAAGLDGPRLTADGPGPLGRGRPWLVSGAGRARRWTGTCCDEASPCSTAGRWRAATTTARTARSPSASTRRSCCAPTGRLWNGSPAGSTETTDVTLSVLFTPWGEGLTRSWYRDAMVALSHLPHVDRVAIQTNLAARVDWLARGRP